MIEYIFLGVSPALVKPHLALRDSAGFTQAGSGCSLQVLVPLNKIYGSCLTLFCMAALWALRFHPSRGDRFQLNTQFPEISNDIFYLKQQLFKTIRALQMR